MSGIATRLSVLAGFLLVVGLVPVGSDEPPSTLKVVVRNPAGVFVKDGATSIEGFDIDLLDRYLAWHRNRTGSQLEIEISQADGVPELLEQVRSGSCDLAIGSITITEERALTVDFSSPYLPVRMVLFTVAGRLPEGPYQTVLEGRRVGALAGSTGARRVKELGSEVRGLVEKDYPTYHALFAALLARDAEIDAVVTDVTHFWVLSMTDDVALVAPVSPEQGLGVVFPKGSPLKESFDAFVDDYCTSRSYYALVERYFGDEAARMVLYARGQ
jgi:ABC-type amino acid transport substrate-binding protein